MTFIRKLSPFKKKKKILFPFWLHLLSVEQNRNFTNVWFSSIDTVFFANLTFAFGFELKSESNKQTKLSRANQNVFAFRNQKQSLRWDCYLPLSKVTFVEFFCVSVSVRAHVRMMCGICPVRLRVHDRELLYHLCELEKYFVSFPIFSAAKPMSKEILNLSTSTVEDIPQ